MLWQSKIAWSTSTPLSARRQNSTRKISLHKMNTGRCRHLGMSQYTIRSLLKGSTTMAPHNQITVLGQVRSSEAYGSDYLSELRRILTQFVKPVTRSYLEWGAGNTTLAIVEWHNALPVNEFYSIEHDGAYLDDLVKQIPPWVGFH